MRRPTWIAVVVMVGIIAAVVSIIVPLRQRQRPGTAAERCPRNLRQIGQALLLYSLDHDGKYPGQLDALLTPDLLGDHPELLRCPENDKPYIFLAPGGVAKSYADLDAVVCEPPEYHGGDGSNVLFGDGHVAWEFPKDLEQDLARASTQPSSTRPSATQPAN